MVFGGHWCFPGDSCSVDQVTARPVLADSVRLYDLASTARSVLAQTTQSVLAPTTQTVLAPTA